MLVCTIKVPAVSNRDSVPLGLLKSVQNTCEDCLAIGWEAGAFTQCPLSHIY
jgi:hypothetical protein